MSAVRQKSPHDGRWRILCTGCFQGIADAEDVAVAVEGERTDLCWASLAPGLCAHMFPDDPVAAVGTVLLLGSSLLLLTLAVAKLRRRHV